MLIVDVTVFFPARRLQARIRAAPPPTCRRCGEPAAPGTHCYFHVRWGSDSGFLNWRNRTGAFWMPDVRQWAHIAANGTVSQLFFGATVVNRTAYSSSWREMASRAGSFHKWQCCGSHSFNSTGCQHAYSHCV